MVLAGSEIHTTGSGSADEREIGRQPPAAGKNMLHSSLFARGNSLGGRIYTIRYHNIHNTTSETKRVPQGTAEGGP